MLYWKRFSSNLPLTCFAFSRAPDLLIEWSKQGLADSGNFEGVSNLVSEMKRSPTCVLDRVAYTAIIDAFIVSGCPEGANALPASS